MLRTSFTRLMRIKHPVVLAPMNVVSGGALAAAVSKAGGLGIVGVGYSGRAWLDEQIAIARQTLPVSLLGFGFITWFQRHHDGLHPHASATPSFVADLGPSLDSHRGLVEYCLSLSPACVVFSFGDARHYAAAARAAGVKVLSQVTSIREAAEVAAYSDAVICQGAEAGGHGRFERSLTGFVPAAVDALVQAGLEQVPVLAAGGIADGRGLAASLALGASGAVVGTGFCATREALLSDAHKQLYANASGGSTVLSSVVDIIRGPRWPPGFTGRVLANELTRAWAGRLGDLEKADVLQLEKKQYAQAVAERQLERVGIFAGEGLDLVTSISSAEDVVNKMVEGALATVEKLHQSKQRA